MIVYKSFERGLNQTNSKKEGFGLKETLLDRVLEAKKDYEVGQVIYYNNGEVGTEVNAYAKKIDNINDNVQLSLLMDNFCDATATYGRHFEMDTMEVGLLLGLIYKAEDVDENKMPLKGAQPVNNIVRYYDVGFNCYSDGQKTNDYDFGKIHVTYQGYVHYDRLVKEFANSGIEFTGPKTFKEFKEAILNGEVFDVNLIADLSKGKTKSLSR